MMHDRFPSLDDLAFEGRNKDYGAYDIRRKYGRRVAVSILAGILILLLCIATPWIYFYFEPVPLIEGDLMYEVEYFDMSSLPDDPGKLARALSVPPKEELQAPVVADSVAEKEIQPVEEKPDQKQPDEETKVDSSASPGSSGPGGGTGDETGVTSAVDVYPRYPGGDDARLYYLRKNTRYPEAALKTEIQGIVMVLFIVEVDGSLTNVNVQKKIGGGCDEEAIRVTREMPRWEPGKRNGRAVRVMVRMPIVFRMPGRTAPK